MIIDPYSWRQHTIHHIAHPSPRAVIVSVLRPPDYTFLPGQHAIVRVNLPDGTRLVRQYSYASDPSSPTIDFAIVHQPGGIVSGWFNDRAQIGDNIDISQPFTGPLQQDIPRAQKCLFIAGGSGIAPIMSHIRTLRASKNHASIHLLYSTRTDSLCFADELSEHLDETIHYRLTDSGPRFTKTDILTAAHDAGTIMICGSRQFVVSIQQYLHGVGEAKKIAAEAFSQ